MKKVLLVTLIYTSLIACTAFLGSTGGSGDIEAGIISYGRGDYDEAIWFFTRDIESGKLSHKQLAITHNNRGNAWVKKGDYDRAVADYTRAIEIDPKFAGAYYNRGLTLMAKGDYDRAVADYTRAIELDPYDDEIYYNRGLAWAKKGDYDRAVADFNKSIEINPKCSLAYYNRGNTWCERRDYDHAIIDYTKAVEFDPKNADAYYNRGLAWSKKGDYGHAISDVTKAVELVPKEVIFYDSLAWLMATCPDGRYRDGRRAVELAEKALKLKETSGTLDTLAAAYAEVGKFQDAAKTQIRAITRLKQEGCEEELPAYEERLSSYKTGKPWREK